MRNRTRYTYAWLSAPLLLACSTASFAGPFSIVTAPGTTLPSTVIEEGKSYAYYKVTNITSKDLEDNYVKNLPDNVEQVTVDPHYCGETFTLDSGDYCTLKLVATDTVSPSDDAAKNIFVCSGYDCSGVEDNEKLNIQVVSALAAGAYQSEYETYNTLLAQRQGDDWQYIPMLIPEDFDEAEFLVLNGISCAENFCMASGVVDFGLIPDLVDPPLLAMTTNGASAWAYNTAFTDYFGDFDSAYTVSTSCASGLCVTGGYGCYNTGDSVELCKIFRDGKAPDEVDYDPILAYSTDGVDFGIFDVITEINLGFCNYFPDVCDETETKGYEDYNGGGQILATGCSDSSCVAGGNYASNEFKDVELPFEVTIPLLLTSDDDGDSWRYVLPITASGDVDTCNDDFSFTCPFDYGQFNAVTCSNEFCLAAGVGYTGGADGLDAGELIVAVQGGNDDWYYAEDFIEDFYGKNGIILSIDDIEAGSTPALAANCSGDLCVIAGSYIYEPLTTLFQITPMPFIVFSQDGFEDNVTYVDLSGDCEDDTGNFICPSNTPSSYEGFGYLTGVSCDGNTCVAVGYYADEDFNYNLPLLLQSLDNGNSWSYVTKLPSDIDKHGYSDFTSVNCAAGACYAAGQYQNSDGLYLPLLAQSFNGGSWTYVNPTLPNDYIDDGGLLGMSAPGNGNQAGVDIFDFYFDL